MFLSSGGGSNAATPIISGGASVNDSKTILQAHLGNNLTATSFVSGNANVVNDTLRTGNWNFYVAGNTSIASVTGASGSSGEWTVGNLLSYVAPGTLPTDTAIWSPFTTTVYDSVGNKQGTLLNGAKIAVDAESRTGGGYLSLSNTNGGTVYNGEFFKFAPLNVENTGLSFSFWGRFNATTRTNTSARIFELNTPPIPSTDPYTNRILMARNDSDVKGIKFIVNAPVPAFEVQVAYVPTLTLFDNAWRHYAITIAYGGATGESSTYKIYVNGSLVTTSTDQYPPLGVRAICNIGSWNDDGSGGIVGGIDNFQIFNRTIDAIEVGNIYGQPVMYHSLNVADINPSNALQVGDLASESYVYNATLANGARITSTQTKFGGGSLDLSDQTGTGGFAKHLKLPTFTLSGTTGFSVSLWLYRTASGQQNVFDFATAATSGNNNMLLIANDASTDFYPRTGPTTITGYQIGTPAYIVPLNVWVHICITISVNSLVTIYADGVSKDARTPGTVFATGTTKTHAILGAINNGIGFTGHIDDFRIYNRELTQSDVTALYGNTLPAPPSNKIVSYNFNNVGNFTGTLINGAYIAMDGSPGPGQGYLSLTAASSHYATLPSITFSSNTGLTFACWFRSTATGVHGKIMDFGSYSDISNNIIIFNSNGDVGMNVRFNNAATTHQILTTGIGFNDNVWRHLVWTISPTGTWNAYINGVINVANFAGVYPLLTTRSSNFIGRSNWTPVEPYFNGGIDDFRMYNRAITAEEVSLIYSQVAMYFPLNVADINGATPTLIGEYSTGSYVYNARLMNGARITSTQTKFGGGSLDLSDQTGTGGFAKHLKLPTFTLSGTTGFSVSLWVYRTASGIQKVFDFATAATSGNNNMLLILQDTTTDFYPRVGGGSGIQYATGSIAPLNAWFHICITISTGSLVSIYTNGVFRNSSDVSAYSLFTTGTTKTHAILGAINNESGFTGHIDDFRIYHRPLSSTEVSAIYAGSSPPTIKDTVTTTGATWMPIPGTLIDSSETNYTVKSNEVALLPGTNSTYAVWTATKSTNLKIDVSFADYNSRSANGVGFQMFKIKSDNTFDSVLFPRTVTSTALTNANSSNYLYVPTINTTVNAGDKIYYRVDGNGISTSASSILATTIFTDAVSVASNPVENKLLQANLGNNLALTSFVAGNANVVLDTLRTGDWKFYVAGNTSIASITGASGSSGEWTSGNLLSYGSPLTMHYTFNSDVLSSGTITDLVSNQVATLANGAKTSTSLGVSSKYGGALDLSTQSGSGVSAQHLKLPTFTVSASTGFSVSFWFYQLQNTRMMLFDFASAASTSANNMLLVSQAGGSGFSDRFDFYPNNTFGFQINTPKILNEWIHICITIRTDNYTTVYQNAIPIYSGNPGASAFVGPAKTNALLGAAYNFEGVKGYIDDFRIFNREITQVEVTSLNNGGSGPGITLTHPTGANWMPAPGTPVISSETSYTVKSNEIALIPGANSTYAVWTSPKSTNIKIDVSFADYHSRSANGVGFQIFKINADNTFGSVIFPRTTTSTALTNSTGSYLTVPSKTISVATGDKIYYRIDGNGISTAASSVLATNIYVDPNPDLKQNTILQAHLGNNLALTSFVGGNANVVNDTLRTGNWNFYVAGNTSVAAVTGANGSSGEWTVGNLLSYSLPLKIWYPLNTAAGTTSPVGEFSTGTYIYNGTLLGGATISTDGLTRVAGGYLKIASSTQYLSIPAFTIGASGISFACWFRSTVNTIYQRIFEFGNGTSNNVISMVVNSNTLETFLNNPSATVSNITNITGGSVSDGVWRHVVWTMSPTGEHKVYVDKNLLKTMAPGTGATGGAYPTVIQRNFGFLSQTVYSGNANGIVGGIEDFRYYETVLSQSDVDSIYAGGLGPSAGKLSHTTGTTWMPIPGTVVDSSETSYTVKSNEVALLPGTNSTYAVWTATKSTNLKIDVSFADYNSRSANGVGFQMFKIKSDNTFDSVLFPRTVTSTALTNAASTNYLYVPTINTTVNAGDKIYYRIDANGITTAASSVLATTIFTDAVSVAANPAENKLLQANLGNNLALTSFVGGNANVVLDTLRTGSWQFYVAGNTSVAAVTGLSGSSGEWTMGNLIPYTTPLTMNFTFDTNIGINTYDSVSNQVAILGNGAPILTTNSRTTPTAGYGYVSMSQASKHFVQLPPITNSTVGMSFSFWMRPSITGADAPHILSFGDDFVFTTTNIILFARSGSNFNAWVGTTNKPFSPTNTINVNDQIWKHIGWTLNPVGPEWKMYLNGALINTYTGPTNCKYPNPVTTPLNFIGRSIFGDPYYNGDVDDFRYYTTVLSPSDVTNIYNGGTGPTAGKLSHTTGATWITTPGTVVDSTETSYTVKSNEIALIPGANSTYAVWTSPKSTNIKIDVSFADYHTRSANGVGFQIFKINADNTFGSVIFPRTTTSTALTNSTGSYLTVPSKTISVATGDKIYYRIDGNGISTAASSVLAINIYVDPNPDLKQYKYLQAHLGNNIATTTFVAGNANVANDTLKTGSWNFYVAGNASAAAVTGLSGSSGEWTGGTLLIPSATFTAPSDTFSGNLLGGATYVADVGSRVPGKKYLKLVNVINATPYQCARIPAFLPTTNGISFSFWIRHTALNATDGAFFFNFRNGNNNSQTFMGGSFTYAATGYLSVSNNSGNPETTGIPFSIVGNGNWHHIAWTMSYSATTDSTWKFYLDGVASANTTFTGKSYMNIVTRTYHNIGTYDNNTTNALYAINGGVDDFQVYHKVLTDAEVLAQTTITPAWMPTPGTAVDSSETLYTVKSNEVALIPGNNSTYAVWTATKSTNLKIDVSFADYNSRSAGVGFQMFKIKSDNTFDSVLFPRTVTSTALTNANSSNYLTVPTITTTANAGDKIYYRIDANGNVAAASSVLATTIYTDDVSVASNPLETRFLQANLGNNLASATLVAGNANVVLDTLRTGDWKFYVAPSTSIAPITSATASSEWSGGSPLSYSFVSPLKIWYPLNTAAGTTSPVGEFSTGSYVYNGTIVGATISTDAGKRVPGGYLQVTTTNYLSMPPFATGSSGISFCLWFRSNASTAFGRIFEFSTAQTRNTIMLAINGSSNLYIILDDATGVSKVNAAVSSTLTVNNNVWRHFVWTMSPTGEYKFYIDKVLLTGTPIGWYPTAITRTLCYLSRTGYSGNGVGMTGGIEDFRYYATVLSQTDVNGIYDGGLGPTGTAILNDAVTNATWAPAPGTPVISSETSYTVKSNEVALIPGANSTYAVWTAPKSTNIRVDVSFADYHTRAANGVGFQMFKINADNTFGSTIFPRTTTGNAITDATLLNGTASYLTVPSVNLSVSTGDKIYYRIDGNGAPTSASSVLATNIYSYSGRWY